MRCRRDSAVTAQRRTRRSPRWRTRRGAGTACSSIRKSRTRCRASACSSASCATSAAATRAGTPGNIIEDSIARVRAQVGDGKVLLGSVRRRRFLGRRGAAARAIGDQLACVFVDHGLLRWREGDQVMATFAQHMGVNVIRVERRSSASSRRSRGVSGPGGEAQDHRPHVRRGVRRGSRRSSQGIEWLAQGTIYPDVIESAGAKTGKAHVIKSHHNVGGLPERHAPEAASSRCASCSRTRCARIGVELGLPREMVYRHPFPGPGLGVRILGEVTTRVRRDLLRKADRDLHRGTAPARALRPGRARRSRCSCRCVRSA